MTYTKLIIGVLLFLFWCSIIYLSKPSEHRCCRLNRFNGNDQFSSVVIKKELNSKRHGLDVVYLKSHDLFAWHEEDYEKNYYKNRGFYNKISIGDSLIKEEGSLLMTIKNKDTIFTIDIALPCDE